MSIDFDHLNFAPREGNTLNSHHEPFAWRNHWHRVALGIFVLVMLALSLGAAPPAEKTITGHVTKIYDGDTVTIETNAGDKLRVRLADLDAPELKQNHGLEARDALKALLADDAGAVTVTYRTLDKYGRALGTILAGDVNANLAQVRDGHAWAWRERGKPTNTEAAALEATAKVEKRGLWAAERPQAPWDYRAAKRRAQTPSGRR